MNETQFAIGGLHVRVQSFINELKEKEIHVGMGNPAACITCGEVWPCAASEHRNGV